MSKTTDVRIYVMPTQWQLWPIYEGNQGSMDKKICLGPLVIRWTVWREVVS